MACDYPWFTRTYRAVASLGERSGLGEVRAEALQHSRGRLLILGLGLGHDLAYLPATVNEVVGIEPSASMRSAARPRVAAAVQCGLAVELVAAEGSELPLADNSVDSALLALVMCSVRSPDAVLTELRRVLRSGAPVGVMEHVVAPEGTWTRRGQRLIAPIWPHLAGGCQVDRDTRRDLTAAGFDTAPVRNFRLAGLAVASPAIVGTAYVSD